MIYYFYGPDSYRRLGEIRILIEDLKSKFQADILTVDFEEEPEKVSLVKNFLNQPSIFLKSKIVILKNNNFIKEKNWSEFLKKYLKDNQNFLIFNEQDKPLKAFDFLLKKPVEVFYFGLLKGKILTDFLREELLKRKLVFQNSALNYFIKYLEAHEDSTWLLMNELEKISLADLKQPISLNDLKEIINWSGKDKIYFLSKNLIKSKSLKEKLFFLEKMFLQEEASRSFNYLVYQVSPKDMEKLADYDLLIKRGFLDYEEALLDFIFKST